MSAAEAAALINNGETIGLSGFTVPGTPQVVPAALARRAEAEHAAGRPFKINLYTGALTSAEVDDALVEAKAINKRMPFHSSAKMRQAINRGEVSYFDMHLSLVGQYVRYGYLQKVDTCIIEAVGLTDLGEITLSGSIGCVDTYAQVADRIIIELNSAYDERIRGMHDIYTPKTPPARREIPIYEPDDRIGSPVLKVDPKKIVAVVPCHYKYNVKAFNAVDDTTKQLGKNVVDFLVSEIKGGRMHEGFHEGPRWRESLKHVRPDLTKDGILPIQSGVGNISNAVLAALKDAEDIPPFTIYSEVLQDQAVELIDAGRCTFASTGSLAVSDTVYERIMNNIDFYKEHIILRPYEVTNHPEVVRRLGLIAINTALEADIFGNINSTHVTGTKMMNGIGGSADFSRNAYLSIFICPSTAKNGTVSAIVPQVTHVDSSEHSVMILVTEQGVADLRGLSPRERAEVIIEKCAHPDYKPLLRQYLAMSAGLNAHTPMHLQHAYDFHLEYIKSGDMRNTRFD